MLRTVILLHRYLGIATCLCFVMWFVSGVVMMYVGFPQLTDAERFSGLIPLELHTAQVLPSQALAAAGVEGWPRAVRLEMVLGRPAYIVHAWEGLVRTVFADDGSVLHHVTPADAIAAVQQFAKVSQVYYQGQIERDQWTVPGSLHPYRPLNHLRLNDGAGTELYLSDRTGEVVRDTTRRERVWNWCGAVLHWVYFTRLRQAPAVWRLVVLWLSGIGIVSVLTGIVVGLVRWRPWGRYRYGRTSPYHGVLRWHHVLGLVAAVPVLTWIVSGWLSLEPGQWVSDSTLDRVAHERYMGLARARVPFTLTPAVAGQAAPLLPPAKEVRLGWWEGQPLYVFAASPSERWLMRGDESPREVTLGGSDAIVRAAQRLLPAAQVTRVVALHAYDFYWYAHHEPRPLPVLRVTFDDPHATWFHIDPVTGDILERLDASRRWYRILFHAVHSLDFPLLLAYRPAWDLVVITLCGLGLALSVTAVIVAWHRLQRARKS
jgi:hypothetical protein